MDHRHNMPMLLLSHILNPIPKAFMRLLSLLPIIYMLDYSLESPFIAPWFHDCFHPCLACQLQASPLSPLHQSIFHFISIASLPIKLKQDPSHQNRQEYSKVTKALLPGLKVLILAIIISLVEKRKFLHPLVVLACYMGHTYFVLEILLALYAAPARAILGSDQVEPQFNEPYLATSLKDFWGRRWNLTVPNLLRPAVYHPLRRFSDPFLGPLWAPHACTAASFLVSGVMHELLYYCITRTPPTWEVTCFCVLHGVCTVVEVMVKNVAVPRGWRLGGAVSGLLTVLFLAVTLKWLFFPHSLRDFVNYERFCQVYLTTLD